MPPNIITSSLNATSVTISLTQPPFSFTPVNYTVTLTRVTGSDQALCTSTQHSRTIAALPATNNFTSVMVLDLYEFSTYTITVMARFSEFLVNLTAANSANFTTISAGMFLLILFQACMSISCVHNKRSMFPPKLLNLPPQ